MALITAQDYIYQALRRCGQLRPGAGANTDLLSDALDAWKIIFDGYNARRTMQYTMPDYVFPVTGPGHGQTGNGQAFGGTGYQIGPLAHITATTTLNSAVLTLVSNASAVQQGEAISGTGIPANTTVVSTDPSAATITMSAQATASGAAVAITGTPDFVTHRPETIVRMNLYLTSQQPSQPTRIPISLISMEQWMNIAVIQLTAINVTTTAAYDPQWPNGVIWVWPPLNGNSLEIFTWGFLTPPTALSDPYSAPPGYAEVVIWELAKELWALATNDVYVNKLPFQYIAGRAKMAKDAVKAINAPMPKLRNDFRGGGNSRLNACDWSLLLTGEPY